jgi:hypothetical protein
MTTAKWIITGFAISGFASLMHWAGNAGYGFVDHLPFYVPLVLGAAGQYCLYRGMRSMIGDAWSNLFGKARKDKAKAAPRRATGFGTADDEGPVSDFDADAAFARYMEQRAALQAPSAQTPMKPPVSGAIQPVPGTRARGGFGRRVV